MKKRMFFCYTVIFLPCFSMLGSFADGIGIQSSFIDEEATVNAVSSAVSDGIKSFQRYINNNLPMSYLGTALDVDGGCGPLTKTASGGWVYNSSSIFHQNNPYRVSTINNNANFKAYGPAVG